MKYQSRSSILSGLFGKSKRETTASRIRKIGFEPLETRCLLSVSPGLLDDRGVDAALDSSVADFGSEHLICGGGYVDDRDDPLNGMPDAPQAVAATADADTDSPETVTTDTPQADVTNGSLTLTCSEELWAYMKSPFSRKMGTDLFRLQEEFEAHKAGASQTPFRADELGMSMIGEDVVLTVTFDALLTEQTDLSTVMARHSLKLRELGFTVRHMAGPSLIGHVSPGLLDEIASLDEVISLRASYAIRCAGSVIPQGDEFQSPDAAQPTHSVGESVQAGIISDGIAALATPVTYANDSRPYVELNSGNSPHQDITRLCDTTGTEPPRTCLGGSDVSHVRMDTDTGSLDLLYEVIGRETTSGHHSTTNPTSIPGTIPSLELHFWWDGYDCGG